MSATTNGTAVTQSNGTGAVAAPTVPVIPPNHTELYINNIPFDTTVEDLTAWIKNQLNITPPSVNIVQTKAYRGREARSRGYGFVTVPNTALEAALQLNESELDGRKLSIVEAKPREERINTRRTRDGASGDRVDADGENSEAVAPAPPKTWPNGTQLFIKNLDYTVTSDQLNDLFEQKLSSKPIEVQIINNKYGKFRGQSKGYGFVVVPNDKLEQAKSLDNTEQWGRVISIETARAPRVDEDGNVVASTRSYGYGSGGGYRRGGGRGGRGGFRGRRSGDQDDGADDGSDARRRRPAADE